MERRLPAGPGLITAGLASWKQGVLYIWKNRKQERLGEERKRLDLCSGPLCARHPPSAAGLELVGRSGWQAGAGLYHGDGGPVPAAPAPRHRGSARQTEEAALAGFNLLDRGFSHPLLFFCQAGSGSGLAVSPGVRPKGMSSSGPGRGWVQGRMGAEPSPLCVGQGIVSGGFSCQT